MYYLLLPPPYSSILYENPAHNFNGSFILFFHRLLLLLFGDLRSAVLLLFERACVYVCLCVSVCVRVRACVCVCSLPCLALDCVASHWNRMMKTWTGREKENVCGASVASRTTSTLVPTHFKSPFHFFSLRFLVRPSFSY